MPWFPETLTRRRYDAGGYQGGEYVEGAADETTLELYVEPADGEVLERLPEGKRERAEYFASGEDVDIRTGHGGGGPPADELVYEGEVYEVSELSDPGSGAPYDHSEFALLRKAD